MANYNKINKKIDVLTNKNVINTLVSCVFNKDSLIYSNASGISERSFKKGLDNREACLDTKYQIGTMAKFITAIAIMQLYEKNKLALNKSIRKYLPEFAIKNRYSEGEITIRDLLTNRSGIPSINYNLYLKKNNNDYHDVLNYLKEQYLICPPKTMEAESELGYTLLGLIVEQVSQMSYEDYVTENIFKPMDIDIKFIHEYKDYGQYRNEMNISYSKLGREVREKIKCLTPSYSNALLSVNDLVKLFKLFINGGAYKDKQILTKESVDMMLDEPIYKGEVEGRDKIGFGLKFTSKYINSLGKIIIIKGENTYNQIVAILLKDKGMWGVVASDAYSKADFIEKHCVELLGIQIGTTNKTSTSNTTMNYLQCRVEDYAGFYPAKDGGAYIYLSKYLALKYKGEVYRMRLRHDGYFELKSTKLINNGDKKLAYFDKNGLLSIVTTKKNGLFFVEDVGYALKPTTIQKEWRRALGGYKIANSDRYNPYQYKKMKLVIENGYIKMILIRKGTKRVVTLGIVNSREAIALGYGANSNDTVTLNLSNIRYSGMSFDKVKESSVNKVKVKKIDEEKLRQKEHKKKIDKMFDLKK